MSRTASLFVLSLALARVPALAGQAPELLPELRARLRAARYAPSDRDLRWTGWIGAGAGLVRFREVTGYFDADVETIIGSERRALDANQANYHLELGARRPLGSGEVGLFFHHVSRHAQDRPKVQAVDWNIVGLRATGRLPREFFVPTRVALAIGHTTQVSLVGYQWEMTLRAEAEILTRAWGQTYLTSEARLVTTERSRTFPRSGFIDLTAEAGSRWTRGERELDVYAAFEHRNDVFPLTPGSRTRALLGFRIGFVSGDAGRRKPASPGP